MGRVSRAKSLESLTLNRSKPHYPINKQNRNPIRKFLYEIYYRIKRNILRAHQTEAQNLIVPDQCSEACLQNVVDNSHCIYRVSQKKWCIAISNSRVVLDDQQALTGSRESRDPGIFHWSKSRDF